MSNALKESVAASKPSEGPNISPTNQDIRRTTKKIVIKRVLNDGIG
jgi:hypothetical protein